MVEPQVVIIHPLVLLSTVDHYNRVAKNAKGRRVVGVLLGEKDKRGRIDVTNSFGVPFEEDKRDPNVWFVDHNYVEEMANMFRKVSGKERVVGFYSTGPSLRPADLPIAVQIFRKHCKNPVLSIIDIRTDRGDEEDGLPVKSYFPVATVDEARRVTEWTFKHIPSEIGAYQAEEVGVEHLLRDINGRRPSPLAKQIKDRVEGLAGLKSRLVDMAEYLDMVLDEGNGMTVNNAIIFNMQNMLNLLPNISMESLLRAVFLKTNDMHLVMYLASLIRSITALHDLVTNKIRYVSGEVDAPLLTKKKETSAAADADAPAAAAAATK